MLIEFEKIVLHNFLSYGHAEIELQDKGYCLVKGINQCPKDNALSNGAGKTSWASAICWALTGETSQGVTQNIKNIYIDEKSCYVEITFKVNADKYKITRYKEPKPDLKVIVNGEDRSGKGIRESELILAELLPDLTPNLISSVIILGQGLPNKFSRNTPAGRKEVLEKLSKSDFMINDIKNRITARLDILNASKRKYEDAIISDKAKKEVLESQLSKAKTELTQLEKPHDFDSDIKLLEEQIRGVENNISENKKEIANFDSEIKTLNESLQRMIEEKAAELKDENEEFSTARSQYIERKSKLQNDINNLRSEIARLKSIKDVCPTCGQKLPGVMKPDTSVQEKQLEESLKNLEALESKYSSFEKEHKAILESVDLKYINRLNKIKSDITQKEKDSGLFKLEKSNLENKLLTLKQSLNKLELEKESFIKKIDELTKNINSYESSIKLLENNLLYNNSEKDTLDNHLNVLSQMSTLVKRDFRGFLLSNVISYIDEKAKEYSEDIFGTRELEFKLDGNNIDIIYSNKVFESLSGGEKQKVDIIIQFALRSMMSQYLNFSSNILVLDEITDNLDALGCNKVLDLISHKLNDVESIFIISHHADELEIPNDSELVVIKNKEGISLIR